MEAGQASEPMRPVMKAARRKTTPRMRGISAALASAIFLGMSPVFGKLAISNGLSPLAVVAMRTTGAAILLFLAVLIFKRSYLYIYPAGLLGCLLAGGINGLGSILFYTSLGRINASLGQIIYSLYPLFVALWLWLDHERPSKITSIRLLLVLPALYLLIGPQKIDYIGVLLMLGSAALYALHLPINQRVLFDMPAPTVTLYTLFAMSVVVVVAFGISTLIGAPFTFPSQPAWAAVIGLTVVTFLSRLTLFTGVKHLGGLQTALLGLGELLIAIILSHLWLGERLTILQWMGVGLLVASLWLVLLEKQVPRRGYTGGWLSWLRPPGIPKDFPWNPQ